MTDEPPTHPTEPETAAAVDPLDERLSAALDGESAPEHGDAPDAQADGADEPADERRRALAAARDLLAVPPPPLDDVTRRRLLRAALSVPAHDKPRDLKRLNQLGAAAAVLAVVVAGALAIKAIGGSGSSDKSSASKAAGKASSQTTASPEVAPLDLRDVSDPEVLKQRVTAALGATDSGSVTSAAVPTSQPPRTPTLSGNQVPRCLSKINVSKGSTAPRLLADATYKGTPALVAIATNDSGTAVYVLATGDCRLLTYQFLKR